MNANGICHGNLHTRESFPKISCKVENQKHLWWISDWDRSWWYRILTNLLSMILHRSIYFSADTALGLSMESYPCKNRNTKCAVYLTIPWSTGHFRVPKTFTFKWSQMHNFSCENEFYLHQNKNHFHIKGWALHHFLIQKPRETWKWLIKKQFSLL